MRDYRVLSKAAEMEVEGVRPREDRKDMEAMCGTGYERKEQWGGKYSQLKRVEETHRPSNSIRNKRDVK